MENETVTWYVYMLICRDETIYTGVTTDPKKRLAEHNSGVNGAKYTRSRRPVSMVYLEEVPSRSDAASREYRLKRLSRQQKLRLIQSSGFQPDPS
ncbi:MAG TPA: GIY-YIG nuclease family protein [Deltaproteobacteria bacterium]|nr:GIY-YIG nuclease family protein [Deltaproteobacteria bacterium]